MRFAFPKPDTASAPTIAPGAQPGLHSPGALALFFLLLSAGLLLLYGPTSGAELQALRSVLYGRNEMPEFVLQATPARLAVLRAVLAGATALAAGVLLQCGRAGRLLPELRHLGLALRRLLAGLAETVRALSGAERLVAALLLAGLLALRIHYLRVHALGTDEIATYDYFVRGGPLAITGFYPIPNNHVLFSLLSYPLVGLGIRHDVLVLRLPTLLISSAGTVLLYAMLARVLTFRVATLAVGLFCLAPLALYYSVAGRGYFLLVNLAAGQFFAMLAVLHYSHYQRLGWLAFVMLGVLGLYTIPTYAYVLVSVGGWLALSFGAARRWRALGALATAAGLIGAGAALAYAPIVCVSGLPALTANQYIAPQTQAEFWGAYGAFLLKPARELFGHDTLADELFIGAVLACLLSLRWLPARWRRVGAPCLFVVLLPFVLMPLQRVYAPSRVLLYASLFFFVAAVLAGEWVLLRLRLAARTGWALGLLLLAGYAWFQVVHFRHHIGRAAHTDAYLRRAYAWLRPRQPQRVYFAAPFHKLYFHHYATIEQYPLQLFEAASAQGQQYDFLVVAHDQPPAPRWVRAPAYRPVYTDAEVTIFAAGRAAPNRAK
ncbi:hypothetical protein [Hymenobacter latericus]|uniref:hypothetical protein n=1 Tax=Hymenobacter sp. YIM 151858-1 TaxID=2987688 RepID=UPI002225D83F|nr:hypothetical protein [Hymenobacter sp. YIM 151858-1]UYZ60413.1 hypothetical protein OIS50_06335 [Hymenobacter sp. YIM 151858-1]